MRSNKSAATVTAAGTTITAAAAKTKIRRNNTSVFYLVM